MVRADSASACSGRATRGDIIHNAYGYGLFTGGLGIHYGAEAGSVCHSYIRGKHQAPDSHYEGFRPTILTCTPSYALHLAEAAAEMGIDFSTSDLNRVFSAPNPGRRR